MSPRATRKQPPTEEVFQNFPGPAFFDLNKYQVETRRELRRPCWLVPCPYMTSTDRGEGGAKRDCTWPCLSSGYALEKLIWVLEAGNSKGNL